MGETDTVAPLGISIFSALISIANASALVTLSCGRKVAFARDTSHASAAISTARQIQSLLMTSEKYFLQTYHSVRVVPLSFRAIPATSARVILSSRR